MLNYLWSGMLLIGIIWGALHGQLAAVTQGAMDAAKEAVALCITMLGIMSMWTGILEIGKQAGLIDQLSRRLKPFLKFMFPALPPESEAAKQIDVYKRQVFWRPCSRSSYGRFHVCADLFHCKKEGIQGHTV